MSEIFLKYRGAVKSSNSEKERVKSAKEERERGKTLEVLGYMRMRYGWPFGKAAGEKPRRGRSKMRL